MLNEKNYNKLSNREKQVAILGALGKSNQEIANMLFISHQTVKNHFSNINNKLKTTTRSQVAQLLFLSEEYLMKLFDEFGKKEKEIAS